MRTLTFGRYRAMGGRLIPTEMHMQPVDKPGERTVVRYEKLEFDIGTDPSAFSLRALRGGR